MATLTATDRTCVQLTQSAIEALGKRRRNEKECDALCDKLLQIGGLVDDHPVVAAKRASAETAAKAKGLWFIGPGYWESVRSCLRCLYGPRGKKSAEVRADAERYLLEFAKYADELLDESESWLASQQS